MVAKPRVAIIGRGNVGTALSEGLRRTGYDVQTAGKEPKRVAEVARNADVIVLAVPFAERQNVLNELGDTIRGKTVVDATNALTPNYDFAGDVKKSGAEQLQEWARTAHVVKAFNTVFSSNMATGRVGGERLTLFVTGNDAAAKERVLRLGADIGFDAVDAGPLQNARWLEAMGFFNIQLGYNLKMGTAIGFRLARAPAATTRPGREEEAVQNR